MAPIQRNEAMIAVATTMGAMGALYYYFTRISNPFRPYALMRFASYKFGNPGTEDSISSYHGVHYVKLKSVKTLVEGVPDKVCPVRTYTFALPDEDALLANTMSLGHADVIKLHQMPTAPEGVAGKRKAGGHKSYSPTDVSTPGQIDLTVKIYPDGVNSQVFEALQPGDSIGISGPWPPEKLRCKRLPGKKVNLVVFGVGITEAIEVARAELAQKDAERVTLLYANRYKEDAFFRDKLDALKAQHPDRFAVVYLYSREATVEDGERTGRVTAEVLQQVFELPTSVEQPGHCEQRFVIPGSKQMIKDTWEKYLKVFDYNRKDHSLLLLEMFAGNKERTQKMYKELQKKNASHVALLCSACK